MHLLVCLPLFNLYTYSTITDWSPYVKYNVLQYRLLARSCTSFQKGTSGDARHGTRLQ